MTQFKKMAFNVKTPEQSEAVQKKLFEMGYHWLRDTVQVKYTEQPWLHTHQNCQITHCNHNRFDSSEYYEVMDVDKFLAPKLENMRFDISSPEESKAVQEKLFEMGFSWIAQGKEVLFTDEPVILADIRTLRLFKGDILRGYTPYTATIKTIVEFSPKPVEAPKETITFEGKEYNLELFRKRLAELESV